MADDTTLSVDPTTGQPADWLSRLTTALSNPLVQGLAGMSAGFGQAAMPTRMPIPFGAAFGMGMGGLGQGMQTAYKMQLEQQQAQKAQMENQLLRAQMPYQTAQAQWLTKAFQNPDMLQKLLGGNTTTPDLNAPLPGMPPAPVAAPGTTPATKVAPLTPFIASNLPQGVTPEEDQIVRTVIGEAGGEPTTGQQAVAAVIKNRMRIGNQDAQSVIFAPNQFEPWNNPKTRAGLEGIDPTSSQYQSVLNNAVRPVFGGQVADPTGGATHFYSPTTQAALGRDAPAWATGSRTTIGNHEFYYPGYAGNAPGVGRGQAPSAPVVFGDSVGQGVRTTGNWQGNTVQGASPNEVQAAIDKASDDQIKGRDIVLSSGASNNTADAAKAEAQIKALQARGAKSVTLLGVGNRPDFAGINDGLAAIAARTGAQFQPLPQDQLVSGGVHLSPTGNSALVANLRARQALQQPYQVATTGTVPGPPAATPAATGGPPAAPAPGEPAVAPPAAAPSVAAPAPAVGAPGGTLTPGSAFNMAAQLNAQAAQQERMQVLLKAMPQLAPVLLASGAAMQDPAALRQRAQTLLDYALAPGKAGAVEAAQQAVQLQTAGPKAAAVAAAEAPYKLQALGFRTDQSGNLQPIPGGPADPAYVGDKAAAEARAKASVENSQIRGAGGYVTTDAGQRIWVPSRDIKEVQNPDGSFGMAYVTQPDPASGQGPAITPVVGADGKPVITKPSPTMESFSKESGGEYAKEMAKTRAEGASSVASNYLFDNMRRDAAGWNPDAFSHWRADAQSYQIAFGHLFGVPDNDPSMKAASEKVADYTSLVKSSGMLLREAVHETSARAAAQEYTMIGETLPAATTPTAALSRVADQWQALNDFRIAKQQFAQNYQTHPQDFAADWNAKVTPAAFLINRMQMTPQGQTDFARMLQTLKDNGQTAQVQKMLHDYSYAKGAGLFDSVGGGR